MKKKLHQINQLSPQNQKNFQKRLTLKRLRENKKLYIASIIFVIVVIITSFLLIKLNFSRSDTNTTLLLKDQTIDDLSFVNATMDNNKLAVEVLNNTNNNYSLKTINVSYLNSNGEVITTINGYIGNNIGSYDSKKLVVSTDIDLSDATSIKYTVNK